MLNIGDGRVMKDRVIWVKHSFLREGETKIAVLKKNMRDTTIDMYVQLLTKLRQYLLQTLCKSVWYFIDVITRYEYYESQIWNIILNMDRFKHRGSLTRCVTDYSNILIICLKYFNKFKFLFSKYFPIPEKKIFNSFQLSDHDYHVIKFQSVYTSVPILF